MTSRKRVWIAVLCLLVAAIATITFGLRLRSVHAATSPNQISSGSFTSPVAHIANASLRMAPVATPMLMDDDPEPMRVAGSELNGRVIFPQVQEFILTPPDPSRGVDQTILQVRFPASATRSMPAVIPIQIGSQSVLLQRSITNPGTLVSAFDFDWDKFIAEQTMRKAASAQGRMIPEFNGRKFVQTEPMQFIEPAQIEQALQQHQALHFQPQMLLGSTINVFPDHQLMMTNLAIVNDVGGNGNPARTFNQCNTGAQGDPNGAWTFNTLIMAIAGLTTNQNPHPAEQMVLDMLSTWNSTQTVNTFQILPRTNISTGEQNMGTLTDINGNGGTGFLKFWPVDVSQGTTCTQNNQPSTCPSLKNAPMMLEAIVNRIDVGFNGAPFSPAGELRFVFTSTSEIPADGPVTGGPCNNQNGAQEVFNMILEYRVPPSITALAWAGQWNNLSTTFTNDAYPESYLAALNAITNQVVLPNVCKDANNNPISCISQVRSNEILLSPGTQNLSFWELREFHFSNSTGTPALAPATVAQNPDPSFNTTGKPACNLTNNGNCAPLGSLGGYITNIALNPIFVRTAGAAPPVPLNLSSGAPFLGASSLNNQAFWLDNGIGNNPNDGARIDFSVNTCNGCHGREANSVFFQQVIRRTPGAESLLSFFLVGNPMCSTSTVNLGETSVTGCKETVADPNPAFPSVTTKFGDLARRVVFLQTVCGDVACDGGTGNALLLPFLNKPVGVH